LLFWFVIPQGSPSSFAFAVAVVFVVVFAVVIEPRPNARHPGAQRRTTVFAFAVAFLAVIPQGSASSFVLAVALPPNMPTILATSLSTTHAFSKQPQSHIHLIANQGVEHDAHSGATTQHLYLKRKHPNAPNLCQVHLFASEMLAELALLGFPLQPGEIGENLLTQDLDLLNLSRKTHLHIGPDAVLEVTGLRTPCSQIDAFRPGLQQHLWGPRDTSGQRTRRAGIMAIVLTGGLVHPNDNIQIELPPQRHQPFAPPAKV
jgi:MOSC domain-containing protein YiiM